jgi:hypothetical protein
MSCQIFSIVNICIFGMARVETRDWAVAPIKKTLPEGGEKRCIRQPGLAGVLARPSTRQTDSPGVPAEPSPRQPDVPGGPAEPCDVQPGVPGVSSRRSNRRPAAPGVPKKRSIWLSGRVESLNGEPF